MGTETKEPGADSFVVQKIRYTGPASFHQHVERAVKTARAKAPAEKSFELILLPSSLVGDDREFAKHLLETLNSKTSASFDPFQAGLKAAEKLKQAHGGAWSAADLAKNFALSAATLHKRRKEFRIIFWRDSLSKFFYPKWQFQPAGTLLPGIAEILQTFRSRDEWRIMTYFLNPRRQLGGASPLDLLRQGRIHEVLAHAKSHGRENTW